MDPLYILLIDVDEQLGRRIASLTSPTSFKCISAGHEDNLDRLVTKANPAMILYFTSHFSNYDSLSPIKKVRSNHPLVPIILIARHSSESKAIAAIKAGVNDYYKVPVPESELFACILNKLNKNSIHSGNSSSRELTVSVTDHSLVGNSQSMRKIKEYIPRVASSDCTVLITGETGTGKELVAELIHTCSPRKKKPLVKINCAALPESLVESELFGYDRGAFTGAVVNKKGKFEFACGGTVFLDEIGDMNPYAQAKILRSIESKEINRLGGNTRIPLDFRSIAATNKDPEDLISEGKFREDLYYRLNVARMHLPPLRERREDIPELIDYGIKKLNRKFKRKVQCLKEEVMNLLLRYDWPGNVRELMNVLEGTYINLPQKRIDDADLPEHFKNRLTESQNLPADERRRILEALFETDWNKSTAAAKLHWSRMTLYRKIEKYNIVEKRSSVRRI